MHKLAFYGPLGYIGHFDLPGPRREWPKIVKVDERPSEDPINGRFMLIFVHVGNGRYEEVIGDDAVSIMGVSILPEKVPA